MVSKNEERLRHLEQKLNTLWWLTIAQTVMIGVLAAAYFLPFGPVIVVIPLIALPVLFLCRRALPRWARRSGRFVASAAARSASSSPKGN